MHRIAVVCLVPALVGVVLAYVILTYTAYTRPPAALPPTPSARSQVLQLMTPARQPELATFDLDYARAVREKDAAIRYCEERGWVAAMGFGGSVICVRAEIEFKIQYPAYPTLAP